MSQGIKFLSACFLFFLFIWFCFRILIPFTLPFLLGSGLALLAEPLVSRLCRRLPRGAAAGIGVSAAFFLMSALVFLLFSLILRGLQALGGILPDLQLTIRSGLTLLEEWLLRLSGKAPASLQPLVRRQVLDLFSHSTAFLRQGISYILGLAGGLLSRIPGQAFALFTAIISGFMISAKLPAIRAFLRQQLSGEKIQSILRFLSRIRKTAGHWLLAQLKLVGVTLLLLTGGLILLKIPYAPVWALAIALLDALPVLGTGAVLIPWSIVAFLQQDTARALGLLAVYSTVTVIRSVLEPRFVGRQLGLDPLVTLAALYMGYRLWGFGGMLLSPLLAVTALQLLPKSSDSEKTV